MICEHDEVVSLPEAIHRLLQSQGGAWEGTAQELTLLLNTSFTPRALSAKLRHDDTITALQNVGVTVSYRRSHGVRHIVLQETPDTTQGARSGGTVSIDKGAAKLSDFSRPEISFPFSWPWGHIRELGEEEKRTVNAPIGTGRSVHYRHCSLCGRGGGDVLTHLKVSAGYRSYLCRACAEVYQVKARAHLASGVVS